MIEYFITTKFLKHLNQQICKYWYILAEESQLFLKLIWINQPKTCKNPKTRTKPKARQVRPFYKKLKNEKTRNSTKKPKTYWAGLFLKNPGFLPTLSY